MQRRARVTGRLVPLPVGTGAGPVADAMAALSAALDGSGAAVVPVPDGPAAAAVLAMARPDIDLEHGANGERVALVVPTSGSTGEVKGAMLTATALRESAAAGLDRLGGPGQWLLALPLTHVAGLQVLVRSLLAGVEPVTFERSRRFDPAAFAEGSSRLNGARRYTALVPTQLLRILDGPAAGRAALGSFDAVLVGGAALDEGKRDRAIAAGVRVVTTYGMSETCGGCVYDGVPLDGVDVIARPAAPIRIGGPMVFSGYRLRPDLTAAALAVEDGVRWHLTADHGEVDDSGRLVVLGRLDDLISTGGESVPPAAVESALASHPAVRDVVVLGVPDRDWGQRVVAVVVASATGPPDLGQLRAHAARTLGPHALPRRLVLVDEIPLLASGKPDRALLLRAEQSAPPGRVAHVSLSADAGSSAQ